MLKGHRAIESITLDREVAHLKDELMPKYASMIYNGYWWSPERKMLQTMIDASQENVNGVVRLKLYKGNVIVVGRKSEQSLFDTRISTFEDDGGAYNQKTQKALSSLMPCVCALPPTTAANCCNFSVKHKKGASAPFYVVRIRA